MYTHSRKNPIFLVVSLAMLALTTLACSFGGVRMRPHSPVVNITIYEEELNWFSLETGVNAGGNCDHLIDEVTRIELHDGFIRFIGEVYQEDGTDVNGSLDLSLGAENGQLKAEVIAVDIPGMDLNHYCIVRANRRLESAFKQMFSDTQGEILFKEVNVEEDYLKMKLQVNLDFEFDPRINIEFD